MIQRDVLALECVFWESGLKGLGANNWRWKKALGAALALIMSSAAAWKANAPRGNEKSLVETKKQSQESEEKGGAGAEAALKSNWAINYGAQPTKHARVRLPLALFLYTAIGIVSWNSLSHKGNKYIKRYPPPSGDARARSIRSSQVSRRRRRRLQVGLPDIAKSSWKWPPDKKKTESISGRGRTRERAHTQPPCVRYAPTMLTALSCWLTQHAAHTNNNSLHAFSSSLWQPASFQFGLQHSFSHFYNKLASIQHNLLKKFLSSTFAGIQATYYSK